MPLFAPPSSPAPSKDRRESAGRRPPAQRVRKPLSDLKLCNRLVDAPPDAPPAAVLKGAATLRRVEQAGDAGKEALPERRGNRGAGRYGGETVRSSGVQGLKRVGLRHFEGSVNNVGRQRCKNRQIGRQAGVPRPADVECRTGAGPPCRSCMPGEPFDEKGLADDAELELELLTGVGFRTPVHSEGDDEEEHGCMPVVAVTSSPEFLRKLKGSSAGRGCFGAGPLVGSGVNGGAAVRDRRKCKPRGVLIVGAEKSIPSSPDDSKEDGNEKVPKRSVASVEWMVADEFQEWRSSCEVQASAVDMSVTLQTGWESLHRGNEGDQFLKWANWEQVQTMEDSLVMAEADWPPCADKPLELHVYQMHSSTDYEMQGCPASRENEGGDQVNQTGHCCAVGTSADRIKELHITNLQASNELDNLTPLQCSSPQVKGRSVGCRVKKRSDLEGDLVLGACESINPAVQSDLLADGLTARNSYGTIGYCNNTAMESPVRGPQTQTYVVPTNSPESLDVVAARTCAYTKQHVKAGSFFGSLKIEGASGGTDTAMQHLPKPFLRSSKYDDGFNIQGEPCVEAECIFQATSPYMTAGPLADGPAGFHRCQNGKVQDGLPSAVLRKNKICKEKDLVRTLDAITQKKEASDLTGQKKGPGALLGNRVRSLSGLLNSQEVRDELTNENNSKLFKTKYPRRQPESGAIQAMEQGELRSTTTEVEPGRKAFRNAQCKMKLRPRGHPRYGTCSATMQEDTDSESAGILPPR